MSNYEPVSGMWDDISAKMADLTSGKHEVFGVKTVDLIGYFSVVSAGVVVWAIARKRKKTGKKKK